MNTGTLAVSILIGAIIWWWTRGAAPMEQTRAAAIESGAAQMGLSAQEYVDLMGEVGGVLNMAATPTDAVESLVAVGMPPPEAELFVDLALDAPDAATLAADASSLPSLGRVLQWTGSPLTSEGYTGPVEAATLG